MRLDYIFMNMLEKQGISNSACEVDESVDIELNKNSNQDAKSFKQTSSKEILSEVSYFSKFL